jgi:hypothetical protein
MDETKIKRDVSSSAVLNTDIDGLAAYKARRYSKNKMKELETDINNVKQELTDIKNMLQLLIARG